MRLFPIAAALTLTACGTAQSTQYFVLPDSQYIRPAAQGNEIAVKVNLAEPLTNGGLVYQTDAYHVNLAKNHLWAAPLDGALAANLSNKLNRLNPHRTFVPASRSQSSQTLKSISKPSKAAIRGRPPSVVMHNGRTDAANRLTPSRCNKAMAIPPCSNRWKTVCHRLPIRLPIKPKGRLKKLSDGLFHVSNIHYNARSKYKATPERSLIANK